jgi:hypothetical protein
MVEPQLFICSSFARNEDRQLTSVEIDFMKENTK